MTYKSSNPKVVTVDKKGNLKALKTGTAKITIYAKASGAYNKAFRTITVKVVKKAAAPKQTETVKPTAVPKQTETTKPAEPKQTEPDVPKETETEKPAEPPKETEAPKPTETPKETEPPIIEPTEEPAPDVAYVTDISIEKTADDTLYVGEPKDCNIKWESTGKTTRKDFIYESNDTSIATVDESGTITPLKAGKVTITVTSKTPFAAGLKLLE